ncbi:MAG: hypothetical protein QNJ14_10205 [Woeseiaceae bacterium]|nr:hypothetical protein [Woeseiaceae bacterium]
MKLRFISPRIHGILDYAAAVGLIVLPFILSLADTSMLAHWLSVAAGFGLIAYSLATDYAFGATGLLPFGVHLAFDLAAALVFALAPFVFGWSGLVLGYYLAMAAGVLLVVAASDTSSDADSAVIH